MSDTGVANTSSDNRPNVYYDDHIGFWVYRASALGSCPRALTAARLSYPPSPITYDKLSGIFGEGHLHEEAVRRQLDSMGYITLSTQSEVEVAVPDSNSMIRGHTDGVLLERDDHSHKWFLLEVKALGDSTYKGWVAAVDCQPDEIVTLDPDSPIWLKYPAYAWQISFYMAASQATRCLYAVKSRNDGSLCLSWIRQPPFTLDDIYARVQSIELAAASDDLPSCPVKKDYPCAYFHLEKSEPSTPTPDLDAELLQTLTERYLSTVAKIDELTVDKEGLREKILTIMGSAKTWEGVGITASVSTSMPERLKTTQVKKYLTECGVLDDFLTIGMPVTRLTVKEFDDA